MKSHSKLLFLSIAFLSLAVTITASQWTSRSSNSAQKAVILEAFIGSASKPPLTELALSFEKKTGIRVLLHFGGSGRMLSQLTLGGRGDIFLPGSSDYMQLATDRGLVQRESIRPIAWLIPAINVPAGNPANIQNLEDLARPGVRVGMARPDSVCVGLYAREVLQQANLWKQVQANLVTQVDSCARTAQLAAFGTVDAVLGWRVFHYWKPQKIETIYIEAKHLRRIGTIPAAIATSSLHPKQAKTFIDYLCSAHGQATFQRWHYLASEAEARQYVSPCALVSRVIPQIDGEKGE